MADKQDLNTKLWYKEANDIAAPSLELFITANECLGVKVGGNVIIKPIENWFNMVEENDRYRIALGEARARVAKLERHIVDTVIDGNKNVR